MNEKILFVGIDVDDNAFNAALVSREQGTYAQFRCKPSSGALLKKLEQFQQDGFKLKLCYEATYLGYSLARDLQAGGYECEVIAPSSIPKIAGQQVKTDRIDSEKLANFYMNSLLSIVSVPDRKEEEIRDLVRARRFVQQQTTSLRLYILSLCRRMGLNYKESTGKSNSKNWTQLHREWLNGEITKSKNSTLSTNLQLLLGQLQWLESQVENYDMEIKKISETERYSKSVRGLCCYRGIDTLTAMTLVTEIGDVSRFAHPRKLTSFAGMDLREYSSGGKQNIFSMTKMGNRYIRTGVIESCQYSWNQPRLSKRLKLARTGVDPQFIEIADRCMQRLYKKSGRMLVRGKQRNKVKVACAREMLGFVWESLRAAA